MARPESCDTDPGSDIDIMSLLVEMFAEHLERTGFPFSRAQFVVELRISAKLRQTDRITENVDFDGWYLWGSLRHIRYMLERLFIRRSRLGCRSRKDGESAAS